MKLRLAAFLSVASINFAFENPLEQQPRQRQGSVLREEEDNTADVGILSDTLPKTDDFKRRLLTGAKCQGQDACASAVTTNLGSNKCNGYEACKRAGLQGTVFSAGNNACLEDKAYKDAGYYKGSATIGNDSCHEYFACGRVAGREGIFTAGHRSCLGEAACLNGGGKKGRFEVLDDACMGYVACKYGGYYTGSFAALNGACTGRYSCDMAGRSGTFEAGPYSCVGDEACFTYFDYDRERSGERTDVSIGHSSSRGAMACKQDRHGQASFTVGDRSCNCESCCQNLKTMTTKTSSKAWSSITPPTNSHSIFLLRLDSMKSARTHPMEPFKLTAAGNKLFDRLCTSD